MIDFFPYNSSLTIIVCMASISSRTGGLIRSGCNACYSDIGYSRSTQLQGMENVTQVKMDFLHYLTYLNVC